MSKTGWLTAATLTAFAALGLSQLTAKPPSANPAAGLIDASPGDDWPGYGRTYGEQHYSPLADVNTKTVGQLGLVWSYDLFAGNPVSGPIEIGGVLYTATGYSIVRAFNAETGKLLWSYDPKAGAVSGPKLREGWGIRGLAWWNGKVIVGTQDGRLVAVDARNGKPVWSVLTVGKDDYRFISGPPRVFDGKVIIGHGGADSADTRGYVTTYDADTGKQLWRWYAVPGNPAVDTDETTRMAAKSWSGQWWKYGGGGTAWNTFTYDRATDTILIGTGNGAPWNQKIRSEGKGDNLFLCSIVALDAKTGKYKWHYQFNPGETWDYNAAMDMQLADLTIDGKPRKVVIEAPKNGFLYVIDRTNGQLISADKITHVTWASSIDLKTGRPVENPKARFPTDEPFDLFPGPNGAHTWLPSAYSPHSRLVYMPVSAMGGRYDGKNYKPGWKRPPGNLFVTGYDLDVQIPKEDGSSAAISSLLAWDPATRREVWRVPMKGGFNGGVLATGGGLVFEGDMEGRFRAFDGATGKALWSFDAQVTVLGPPISYRIKGRQYVTVLAGMGTSAGLAGRNAVMPVDYRTQPRRVLTFALGGTQRLPAATPFRAVAPADPDFRPDQAAAGRGFLGYAFHCLICHGAEAIANGTAPDLRTSPIPQSAEAFRAIVHDGALAANGMPHFEEIDDAGLADIRQYLRTQGEALRKENAAGR